MIEFALLMPIIIGMFFLLVQVENAISTGIVNNKYSRAMLHFLTFSHRYPLEMSLVTSNRGSTTGKFFGFSYVGVDDKNNFGGIQPDPSAPVRKVGQLKGSEEAKEELPSQGRQNIRIRVVSALCLPPMGLNQDAPFSEGNLGEETFAAGNFSYCRP